MTPNLEEFELPEKFPTLEELLKKSPELKIEDIEHLQTWIRKQDHLPTVPDDHLVSFLHTCSYSVECTKTLIDKHFTLRTHAPEIFANRDILDPKFQKQFRLCHLALFRRTTPSGYCILSGNVLPEVSASEHNFDIGISITFLCVDYMIRLNPLCQGYMLILDAQGITMAHVARASIGTIRHIFSYAQGGLNLKLKAIHVIRVTWIVTYIWALVRSFLPKELAAMLHFHSGEMEEFYNEFPREILPLDYGGTLRSMAEYHDLTSSRVQMEREWILELDKLIVDETRRP